MKYMMRVIALAMILVMGLSVCTPAFAASQSDRIGDSETYTITTHKKKDSTLTVTQSAGKVYATAWKNLLKGTTKTVTKSMRGEFYIEVYKNGRLIDSDTINYPFNSKATFKLEKNSTYQVKVTNCGFSSEILNGAWNPTSWKTYPKVKVSANKSAKVK